MKSKIGIVILVILVIVVAAIAAIVASGGIGIGDGKKVTVIGKVNYNVITGWGVTYEECIVREDSIFALLWYAPWETRDINVVVEMSNGKTYSADGWVGKVNIVLGSVSFSVDLRHIPAGSYTGRIFVYEVEKGFVLGEKNRVLQASTNFGVTV